MSTSESHDVARIIANLLARVYELHERMIITTGGIEGLRDAAALRAAVARPFATFADQDLYPGDFEKAAALFHSLVKSRPAIREHRISADHCGGDCRMVSPAARIRRSNLTVVTSMLPKIMAGLQVSSIKTKTLRARKQSDICKLHLFQNPKSKIQHSYWP